MKKLLCVTIFVLLTFIGCGSGQTHIVWIKDPVVPKKPYGKVLLEVIADYQSKVAVETEAIQKVRRVSDTKFVASHALFLPTRNYSIARSRKLLKDNKIEAVISASYEGGSSQTNATPIPTFNTTTGTATGYVANQNVYLRTTNIGTGTTWVPITTYTWRYRIDMIDFKTGRVVWHASALTSGDDYKAMQISLINRSVEALCKSGLIDVPDPKKCSLRSQNNPAR